MKYLLVSILLATALLATSIIPDTAEAARKYKCNNIKVQVNVVNIPVSSTPQTILAVAELEDKEASKTATIPAGETKVTIPLSFKKVVPCPIDKEFEGSVQNDQGLFMEFDGKITLESIKKNKATKVTVDLS